MKIEIQEASNFLTNLLRLKCSHGAPLELFAERLQELLREHYLEHWFPEYPCKGSGYRCIRINHKMDPILSRAGSECGFNDENLRELFPHELTLWVDPQEVSYRIGENGSICILYESKPHKVANWTPSPPRSMGTWTPSPPRSVSRGCSSDDDSCSSMSISPPSPSITCKEMSFIMEPRCINFELSTYVAS